MIGAFNQWGLVDARHLQSMCVTDDSGVLRAREQRQDIRTGHLEETVCYSEMFQQDVTRTSFKANGEALEISELENSVAQWIPCPENVIQAILQSVSKADRKKRLGNFNDLAVEQCSRLRFDDCQVFLVQFDFVLTVLNMSNAGEFREPVVWIGINRGKQLEQVYLNIAYFSFEEGDSRAKVYIEAVADIDADERHEIVLNDVRYGGRRYVVFSFENGELKQASRPGDSWD